LESKLELSEDSCVETKERAMQEPDTTVPLTWVDPKMPVQRLIEMLAEHGLELRVRAIKKEGEKN
jgi:hypothetical protein